MPSPEGFVIDTGLRGYRRPLSERQALDQELCLLNGNCVHLKRIMFANSKLRLVIKKYVYRLGTMFSYQEMCFLVLAKGYYSPPLILSPPWEAPLSLVTKMGGRSISPYIFLRKKIFRAPSAPISRNGGGVTI